MWEILFEYECSFSSEDLLYNSVNVNCIWGMLDFLEIWFKAIDLLRLKPCQQQM